MDAELLFKGAAFARKRRKWLLLFAAFGFTGYGIYRVYNLPSVSRKTRRLLKILNALISVGEFVSDSAEAAGIISRDLKEFLESDSDEIPNSLKQISKICKSEEFMGSIARLTEAVTAGALRGYSSQTGDDGGQSSGSYDQVLDRLFSSAGTGFASVVVGSFARNMVMSYFEARNLTAQSSVNAESCCSEESSMERWVSVLHTDDCRGLIGDCIQLFVSTAVTVFLDKTSHINTYDDFFAGLTNPKHDDKVRDILVRVCNGAVETLVKTWHHVLTGSGSSTVSTAIKENGYGRGSLFDDLKVKVAAHEGTGGGWLSGMSSTLSVPSNRRFVLDVTGRVTFETVRSFLDFLLGKASENLKRNYGAVHDVAVDKGLEVVRYLTVRSSVVAAVCLSLCLHVLGGARVMMPA